MTAPTDHDLPPLNATPPGLYRHYKGGWYEVIDTVRCSETLQGMTLYRALYGDFGLWVRPAAMFAEHGSFEGKSQPRFTPQDPARMPLGDLPAARALIRGEATLPSPRLLCIDSQGETTAGGACDWRRSAIGQIEGSASCRSTSMFLSRVRT